MGSVGVRELKNRLAHYLSVVRQGETVVATRRGKPVARLVPISPRRETILPEDLEKRLWELAARGVLHWSGEPFRVPRPVATNRGSTLLGDLVVQDRE